MIQKHKNSNNWKKKIICNYIIRIKELNNYYKQGKENSVEENEHFVFRSIFTKFSKRKVCRTPTEAEKSS